MPMSICSYSYEEYIRLVESFHGHVAPGVALGGFMVDLATRQLPKEGLFDAISETRACLPDAIQLLTPCSVGNGWLKIIDVGRFAISLYEKIQGEGVRVFLDPKKVERWSEIKTWFFKLKPKQEQDLTLLMEQIRQAGSSLCSVQSIQIEPSFLKRRHRKGFILCPICREAYPTEDGKICRACQGEMPYLKEAN